MRTFVLLLAGCPAISDADLQLRIDRDGDGQPSTAFGGQDCNDDDPTIHPGAGEACDGVDNDCDGLINAADPDAPADRVQWYLDADGDGFGSDIVQQRTCAEPVGWVHVGGDCDDTDPEQFPGQIWYLDGDGDGFGLADRSRVECTRPSAHSLQVGDCNDANRAIFPGAPELCNDGVDDDCDGASDASDPDVVDAELVYDDADGDGYGVDATERLSCEMSSVGTAIVGGDCDDTRDDVHPGAFDPPYTGGDTNCSGDTDFDADGDGVDILGAPGGGTDCDDGRSWVYPGAPELCNDAPDDCTTPGTWDENTEGVQATFVPADGSMPIDWTGTLETGGEVQIAESGTLFVCDEPPGGWTGTLDISGGNVTVRAARGTGTSTLDASAAGTTNVSIDGPSTQVALVDLVLTGGTGLPGAHTSGGCLFANSITSLEVYDTVFTGCQATTGGGARVDAERVDFVRTSFIGNTADVGGGLYLSWFDDSTLTQCDFDSNTSGHNGGGLYAVDIVDRPLVITGSTFSGNDAVTAGGGIYAAGEVRLLDTTLNANTSALGGGIAVRGSADVVRCSGTGGIVRSGGYGVSVALGTFESQGCDLGAGPSDNSPNDISTLGGDFGPYGAGATVTCTPLTCF